MAMTYDHPVMEVLLGVLPESPSYMPFSSCCNPKFHCFMVSTASCAERHTRFAPGNKRRTWLLPPSIRLLTRNPREPSSIYCFARPLAWSCAAAIPQTI
jgi:hypothetical protein